MKNNTGNHNQRVQSNDRTYFFDLKTSDRGDMYLCLTQLMQDRQKIFDRQRIIVFERGIGAFNAAFMNACIHFVKHTEEDMKQKAQESFPRAYELWSGEDDLALEILRGEEQTLEDLAIFLKRTPGAVKTRLQKRGLDINATAA